MLTYALDFRYEHIVSAYHEHMSLREIKCLGHFILKNYLKIKHLNSNTVHLIFGSFLKSDKDY